MKLGTHTELQGTMRTVDVEALYELLNQDFPTFNLTFAMLGILSWLGEHAVKAWASSHRLVTAWWISVSSSKEKILRALPHYWSVFPYLVCVTEHES
jgi:hypothetical protein